MPDLTKNELEAMRILWRKSDLKPGDIQSEFSWPIENPTLRSALVALVEKGLVVREKRGKTFYYRAKSSERNLMSRMARTMAQVFSGGSTADLIAQLIKNEKLSPREIEQLRRIAKEKTR
jgi:BlaI family transcriptional regulator, penicillinase repressor